MKDWQGLGKAVNIPEAKMEEISLTHKEDVEKCKEHLFKVFSPLAQAGKTDSNV